MVFTARCYASTVLAMGLCLCLCLVGKRLFSSRPQNAVLGYFTPKMGSSINKTPKRHILARGRVVCAIKHENPSTGLTCR